MEIKGNDILGTELEFTIESEDWNQYRLADGSVLRIRPIVFKVFESPQRTLAGDPVYGFAATNVTTVRVPNELKQDVAEDEDIRVPVEFEPEKEVWNTYHLEGKVDLKVKLVVSKVIRTSKKNQFHEPIYIVKSGNVADAELKKV